MKMTFVSLLFLLGLTSVRLVGCPAPIAESSKPNLQSFLNTEFVPLGITPAEVERRTGSFVKASQVQTWLSGAVRTPSRRYLNAFAWASGLDENKTVQAAGLMVMQKTYYADKQIITVGGFELESKIRYHLRFPGRYQLEAEVRNKNNSVARSASAVHIVVSLEDGRSESIEVTVGKPVILSGPTHFRPTIRWQVGSGDGAWLYDIASLGHDTNIANDMKVEPFFVEGPDAAIAESTESPGPINPRPGT